MIIRLRLLYVDMWHSTGGRITFSSQGEGELYGSEVALRFSYMPVSARRSWLDIDHPLPAGSIERFYIYVHNMTALDPQSRRIQLQVWRQVDVTLNTFRLVWLQLIQVSPSRLGALYSVCGPSAFTSNIFIIIIIYLPRTHTTHNVHEEQIAYSRYDKAEVQH